MQFLNQWTVCVCISLTAAVILSLFEPDGSMKRFYRIVISVFVFVSFIYPLKDITINKPFKSFELVEEKQYEENEKALENSVNNEIKKVLTENGIKGANVNSSLNINNENEVLITSVVITVPQEYGVNDVKETLFKELGINAKVIYTGE